MKLRMLAAATVALGLMSATSASAIIISYPIGLGDSTTLPSDQHMAVNFNQDVVDNLSANPYDYPTLLDGYSMTLNGATVGYQENTTGYSGGLPESPLTTYLTVIPGGSATLTSVKGIRSFSFYMGSPDDYNFIDLAGDNGYAATITGATLVAGDTNQQWSWGRRVRVEQFGISNRVTSVTFRSTNYSFELDNIAVDAVPEPASWALMIGGFGMAGGMLRRRRAITA